MMFSKYLKLINLEALNSELFNTIMINIIKGFLKLISLLFCLTIYSNSFAQVGYDWKEPVFMENNAGNEAALHSKLDNNGNVFIFGQFINSITIEDTVLFSSMTMGAYLSKYDNDHNHLWSKLILESKEENPNQGRVIVGGRISIDHDNSVYTSILYTDSVKVDGQLFTVDQSTQYYSDIITMKFSNNGALLLKDHIKGNCPSGISNIEFVDNDLLFALNLSKSGLETLDSCTCIINSDTSVISFENKVIITKLDDVTRIPLWQKDMKASNSSIGVSFIRKNEGNLFLTGGVLSSSSLEYNTDQLSVSSSYRNYVFTMNVDFQGNKKWWQYAGVTGWDSFLFPSNLVVNTKNDILLSLNHRSQSTFNQIHFSDFSSLLGFGNNDESFAVVNYDSLGNIKWKDMSDSRGYETNGGLATDSEHNVYLTSTYIDSLYFGEDSLCSENIWYDQLITSYTKDGQKRWSTTISGPGTERGLQIFIDQEDNMHLLSSVSGSEIRLGGSIDKTVPPESSFFMVKLEKQPLSTNAFSVSENDIKVYPNPNTGSFFIESDVNTEIKRIEIYNALGQLAKDEQSPDAITKVYNLKNGLYLVKVTTENGEVVKKIIVE